MKNIIKLQTKHILYLLAAIASLKIFLLTYFSSAYFETEFTPFIKYFVSNWQNPWNVVGESFNFPYPPLTLYLFSPFVFFTEFFNIENLYLARFIHKIPLLCFDILLLKLLFEQSHNEKRGVILFLYFTSPIVIWTSLINAQIDIIPTTLLFLAIITIQKQNITKAAIFYCLAALTKSHILATLPLVFIYLLKNSKKAEVINFFMILVFGYLLLSLPFILDPSYQALVLNNPEQKLIYNSFKEIGGLKLYLVPLALMLVFIRFFEYKKVNFDLLLSYVNLTFVILLFLTYPVLSWYMWIIPYLVIFSHDFFINKNRRIVALLASFQVVYLVYFLIFYHHPFNLDNRIIIGSNIVDLADNSLHHNTILSNLFFTILEAFLFAFAYLIYKFSIRSNMIYRNASFSTLIGIGGDSGSGKSQLLGDLSQLFGSNNITALEGDGEHKWERGSQNWEKYTHLDPRANKIHEQLDCLQDLKNGNITLRRDYDHDTGKFTDPKKLTPKKFIVLSGLHTFYLPKARKVIDIKIFMDTSEELQRYWKIHRDINKRGYSKEKIEKQIKVRSQDRKKYILPQANFSDLKFNIFTEEKLSSSKKITNLELSITVEIDASINLERLMSEFNNLVSFQYYHDYSEDLSKQIITCNDKISGRDIANIAAKAIPNITDIIDVNGVWLDDIHGLKQLFTLIVISEHMQQK